MMSNMINHYNGALTTAYNKIATLEAQNVQLQAELTSLPESSTIAKTKYLSHLHLQVQKQDATK